MVCGQMATDYQSCLEKDEELFGGQGTSYEDWLRPCWQGLLREDGGHPGPKSILKAKKSILERASCGSVDDYRSQIPRRREKAKSESALLLSLYEIASLEHDLTCKFPIFGNFDSNRLHPKIHHNYHYIEKSHRWSNNMSKNLIYSPNNPKHAALVTKRNLR